MSDKWKVYDREEVGFSLFNDDDSIKQFSPICEIDVEPDIHDHIIINGQRYSFCMLLHKERIAVARSITLGEEHDTEYTSNAICPHCGYEDADCFEWSDEGEHNCGRCDLPFKFVRQVEVTYSTEKIGESYKKPIADVND